MTIRLEKVLEVVRRLPEERQDELAELLEYATQQPAYTLTADDLKALEEGIADADAGRFATDEEVEETFARFGRR